MDYKTKTFCPGRDKDFWPVRRKKFKRAPYTIERFKLLRVIGDKIAQIVESATVGLASPAIKVFRVDVELEDLEHSIFCNKVVTQGDIHLQIFYVDETDTVRHEAADLPFETVLELPGLSPDDMEIDIQHRLLSSEVITELLSPTSLSVRVVVDLFVKVSEFVQRDLLVADSNIISTRIIT